RRYPLVNSIINFGSIESELSDVNWSRQQFEEAYKELGDWDSIYDWDSKHGTPRNASKYKYARVKGKILDMLKPAAGDCILDLGCGNGYFVLEMLDKFSPGAKGLNFIGVDASKYNIITFQKKVRNRKIDNVDMFIGRGEMLPFKSNSISWITCSEVLEHIEDKVSALREVYRTLAPGGRFLFTTPSGQAVRNWRIVLFPFRFARRLFKLRFRKA
ncbi:unnamed protein product, partial [marine sediment metagenome]